MEVCVLGTVEASVDGHSIAVGAGKPRALLAFLALNVDAPVSADRLIQGLWGEQPPTSAGKLVQLHVSQLRKALAAGNDGAEIVTRGRSYELRLGAGSVDADRFERLVAEGAPREALALWRGPPLEDVADEPFAAAEIRRLEDLRLAAAELAVEDDLAAGRHRELIGELDALIAQEPLNERLHAQRMLALYRSGRQADSLEGFRRARATLVERIGVEPGPELRRLHEAILRQDPSLDLPPAQAEALPPELEAGTPLAGREHDLDRLREQWRRARGRAGRLVLIAGEPGMGKTRLAAELAAEVHRDRGHVFYASGAGPAEAALAAVHAARRPTLLVLDDLDLAGAGVQAAVGELAGGLAARPVLIVATARDAALAAQLRAAACLNLTPLDAEAVRAVARFHGAPAAGLLEETGGVPRRVHRTASERARAEATRRLRTSTARAAHERADLRAAEGAIADDVAELQAVSERITERHDDGDSDVVVCPFKGLAAFDVGDAEFFFGRERLVAEMVARLAGAPLMGIVGPSGSGKSSVLRAGLLAALTAGVLPGSEDRRLVLLRPGEHPLRALEHVTAYVPPWARLTVAVDQFEECFTSCHDEAERAAFAQALVALAGDPDGRALVLVAVRADFYGRCAAYPELARLLGANHVLVGPMRREDLRRAIELPARRAGLRLDPELTDALAGDVEGEPGGLPLLSTALLELWQHRDGRRLRMSEYEHAGGVRVAVGRLAESAYSRLEPEQRDVARRILVRLAGEGEGDAVVRRRVPLAAFEGTGEAAAVLDVLADHRLVTIDEGAVEVAHEALLREWPRLRGWLEDDAEGRRLHRHLAAAAHEWSAAGRDPGELYRGARLAAALDWAASRQEEIAPDEHAFLAESRAAHERSQRRLRAGLAGVAVLLVLAVIAGLVALQQGARARDEATAAAAQRLGAQAITDDELDHGLLLARQGVALHDSPETRANLLATLLKSPAVIGVVRGGDDPLIGLDLSPDGSRLAFVDRAGTVMSVDARTRRPPAPPYAAGGHEFVPAVEQGYDAVRFSPDGRRVAVGGTAPVILDARTHRFVAGLRVAKERFVSALRFSPDGSTLFAVVASADRPRGTGASAIQRIDAHSGRPLGGERSVPGRPGSVDLFAGRDGRLVTASAAGGTVVWDPRTLRPLKRLPVRTDAAALSDDGRTLLAGGADGSVRFVDLNTGEIRRRTRAHDAPVVRAGFAADGRRAVTAGADGRAVVWDVERATALETLEGHGGRLTGLAVSPDGATLYTAGPDSKVVVWDLAGTRRLYRSFAAASGHGAFPPDSFLSPDGRMVVIGHDDGTVTSIDTRTLRPLALPLRALREGQARPMALAPRGDLLAVGGQDGFLALVDARSGRVVMRLHGHRGPIMSLGFSSDGRRMVSASAEDVVRVWALPSGRPIGRPLSYREGVGAASISPDGRTVAVTHSPQVSIIDVATGRRRASLSGDETVAGAMQFTRDGHFLVGTSDDGWARVWSVETAKPVTGKLAGSPGVAVPASVSADGHTLAMGGVDGAIRLWDLRDKRRLGTALLDPAGGYVVAAFTPDGAFLIALTGTGRAYRWDMRPSSWARHACAVAGRRLTRAEWEQALPGRDYEPACAG